MKLVPKKLKVDPTCIVTIGDDYTDILAGNHAGMMSLSIDKVIDENILTEILENQKVQVFDINDDDLPY